MENNKKIIITVLSVLICIMAIGYALLAQELTINGSASIDSTWRVEITNITQKEINGGVTEKSKSYTATTANFDIGFTQPGDYVIYDIEVTNSGTLDAVISNINIVTDNNPAIIYTTSGLQQGDKITKNGDKKYLTVKIEYDSNVTSQPALDDNDITLQMDYQQDLGQFDPITYETYSIGDKITFAGSDWYVIKNSTSNEDYVTVMKERVLTNAELGEYAYNETYDTMEYTWTETCHNANHGYSNSSYNCDNTNSYETSKVKEMLEGTYINTIGADNLKKLDGYKIRLITTNELNEDLGWINLQATAQTDNENANVPAWIYQNFGDRSKNVNGYFTMTPLPDQSSRVWYVIDSGKLGRGGVENNEYGGLGRIGVRPVINLLKSAIE